MRLSTLLAGALLAVAATAQAGTLTFATSFAPEGGGGRTGTGFAYVFFDDVTHVLSIAGEFSGLSGNTTVAHFHCCTALPGTGNAGIAVDQPTLPGFPVGVKSGVFDPALAMIDLDDPDNFGVAFLAASGGDTAAATQRLLEAFVSGNSYLNIHTSTFGGGEIRGFMHVPEPSSAWLAALAIAGLGTRVRVQRRR